MRSILKSRTVLLAFVVVLAWCGRAAENGDWPAFHGTAALTGASQADVPEKPVLLWRTKVEGPVVAPPVGGAGRIYCLGEGALVTALDMQGNSLWSTRLMATGKEGKPKPAEVVAPLLYVEKTVIAAAASGHVYALDAATGDTRWKHTAGDDIQGAPAFARTKDGKGLVLVMLQPLGAVRALDPATGDRAWESEPTARCDGHMGVSDGTIVFGNCDAGVQLLSAETGKKQLFIALGEGHEMAGGTAVDTGHAYAGSRSGALACANLSSGKIEWINEDGGGELFTTPAVAGNRVVFCSGDSTVFCVNRPDGNTVWRYETGGKEPRSPAIAGDKVVAATDGTLFLLSLEDGKELWKWEVSDLLFGPTLIGGMIVAGTDDGHVLAFGTGKGEDKGEDK